MWKNFVEPDRPQITIWRMRIVCWITKATNTHSEYAILNWFSTSKWLHNRTSLLHCKYIDRLEWFMNEWQITTYFSLYFRIQKSQNHFG